MVLAGLVIFAFGFGVGDDRIKFGVRAPELSDVAQGNLPADLDYSSVEDVYDLLKRQYDGDLDVAELLDGLKDGLAQATGDPYTDYMNAQAVKEFDEELEGSFTGIGAQLAERDNAIIIEVPLAGYPAERAGLKARDVIIEVEGENALEMSVTDAVKKIRGEAGTKVKLKVLRDGGQQLDFEITREQISIPSVTSEVIEGIGYLKISRFGRDTANLSREAALQFKQSNVRGVVVDLRNNPGGLLESAVDLSSIWLKKGQTVLQEKRGGKVVKTYNAKGNDILNGVPTTVLINEGSASASEIMAGALRDNKAATLIGAKSFGKGSVQSLESLTGGGALKVTIARWFTPAGKNIDKEGIEPDEKVERTDDDIKNNRDPQKDRAFEFLKR